MLYFTGDLHGDILDSRLDFMKGLSKDDTVICLGDFGFDWSPLHIREFNAPCKVLFLAGNHENYNILRNLPQEEMYGSTVGVLKEGVYHLLTGNVYDIDNNNIIIFGGARSIDQYARIPEVSWWADEIPPVKDTYKAMANLEKVNYDVQYLLTHTCSDDMATEMFKYNHVFEDPAGAMVGNLVELLDSKEVDYKHFFGHHHRYVQKENHTCLFREVYCVETGSVVFTGD